VPMINEDLFSYIVIAGVSALGGVTITRYCNGFGLRLPWLVGPGIAAVTISGLLYLVSESDPHYPTLGAALLGALVSILIAWWRLKDGRPDRW